MKILWPRYVIQFIGRRITMRHVLIIGGKRIKEQVHWQNNPKYTPRYEAETL
jgi:hypothetical protein